MEKIKVIAVVGPTASGKTSLAVKIAQSVGGEIISADSMQIYKGMDIATAKPSETERGGIPHHLMDFLNTEEAYSAARFVSDAGKCISDIVSRSKTPIVAGGTGLYIDSLLGGVDFGFVPDNTRMRRELKERMVREGAEALLSELSGIDAETASRLHENDESRIIRALEVYYLTGETITEQKRKSRENGSDYDALYICIEFSDRQKLYERINSRVDSMLEAGLVEEARRYAFLGENTTAKQAIGYKELLPYLKGECTLEEAAESLKRATRRYAKRQMTWFRRNGDMFFVHPDSDADFEKKAIEKASEFLGG